jgi:hypothetical protein
MNGIKYSKSLFDEYGIDKALDIGFYSYFLNGAVNSPDGQFDVANGCLNDALDEADM